MDEARHVTKSASGFPFFPAALPVYELAWHLMDCWHLGLIHDDFDEEFSCKLAHVRKGKSDCGKRGALLSSKESVIKSDDCNVIGYAESEFVKRVKCSGGNDVTTTKECIWWAWGTAQLMNRVVAVLHSPWAEPN